MCIVNVSCADDIEVFMRGDGQKGVRAKRDFKNGEFVMEFEGNLLTEENKVAEREYAGEDRTVYNVEVNIFI